VTDTRSVTAQPKTSESERRYDLDWLRVLLILVVFVFHCGRFFDTGDWHVKNPVRHAPVMAWTGFLASWMMPLMFAISGASIWYALRSRKVGIFIRERALRLLVPLLIGIFTHIAVQVYLERKSFSGFTGSFFDFYPFYFHGWYGFGGNFAWSGLHLWYLEMLFIYSVMLLPLFLFLQSGPGNRLLDSFGRIFKTKGAVYLLALPQMTLAAALSDKSFWGQRGFGGWAAPVYVFFLLYGFVFASQEVLERQIDRLRRISLWIGGGALLIALVLWKWHGDPEYGTMRHALALAMLALGSWCYVIGLLGVGRRRLMFSNRFVRYANEAVLPFYVLHQTIILLVGYFVVCWAVPDLIKFVTIGVISFVLIAGIYEFGIRRFNFMRFLFGMKCFSGTKHPGVTLAGIFLRKGEV
jgi:peptidoglycan/LPS O-acetylase OafA/YrhL